MTDLTKEELDELAAQLDEHYRDHPERNDLLTWLPAHTFAHLIAMAKRTEAAERERDALRSALYRMRQQINGYMVDNSPAERVRIDALMPLRHAIDLALAQTTTDAGGAE